MEGTAEIWVGFGVGCAVVVSSAEGGVFVVFWSRMDSGWFAGCVVRVVGVSLRMGLRWRARVILL